VRNRNPFDTSAAQPDSFRQQADTACDRAALVMDIGAKPPDALAAEAQVHGLVSPQFVALRLRKQRQQKAASFLGSQWRTGGRQRSRDPQRHRSAGDQQQVRSSARRTPSASN